MHFATHKLRWRDVAPEKRRFDEILATQIVSEFLRDFSPERLELHGYYHLESCLDQLLVQQFGVWICGWRSGEDGGPVQSQLNPEAPPDQQTLAVLSAVREWRAFLEAVDATILDLPLTIDRYLVNSIEIAAGRLIPIVLACTEAQDAWYTTCALALNWYLEAQGFGDQRSRSLIESVFRGQFDSWVAPSTLRQKEACRLVGETVASLSPPRQADCLERWLEVREPSAAQFAHFPESYPPLRCDGHRFYMERHEKDRRMLEALQHARRWAEGSEPLSVPVLQRWQAVVLGKERVELRAADAFAKLGRERYGIEPLGRLEEFLSEADDPALSPPWRAALAYLDICFFHPFEDGNARLARLVLDAILWRHGYALNYVEPAFVVARAAEDTQGGTQLALTVSDLMGERPRPAGYETRPNRSHPA